MFTKHNIYIILIIIHGNPVQHRCFPVSRHLFRFVYFCLPYEREQSLRTVWMSLIGLLGEWIETFRLQQSIDRFNCLTRLHQNLLSVKNVFTSVVFCYFVSFSSLSDKVNKWFVDVTLPAFVLHITFPQFDVGDCLKKRIQTDLILFYDLVSGFDLFE